MSGQALQTFKQSTTSPHLVILNDDAVSTDAALCAWLESLLFGGSAAPSYGDGGGAAQATGAGRTESMLWACKVANNRPAAEDSGTAYIVSSEVAKRIRARRYP